MISDNLKNTVLSLKIISSKIKNLLTKSDSIESKIDTVTTKVNNITFDTSDLAQRTDVKDGNDTAIGLLKDQTNGLAAIKQAIAAGGGGGGGGGDATAANQATIIAAVKSGTSPNEKTAVGLADTINDNLGNSNSSDSSPSTLWGKVKQLYNYVSGTLATLLGTPDTNHTIAGDAGSASTHAESADNKLGTLTSGQSVYADMAKDATITSLATEIETTHPYAKEATLTNNLGDSTSSDSGTPTTLWGKVKQLYTFLTGHITEVQTTHPYARETNATANTAAIIQHVDDVMQTTMSSIGLSALTGVPTTVYQDDGTTTNYTLSANTMYYFKNRETDLNITLDLTSVTPGDIPDFHMIVYVASPIALTVTIKDSDNNNITWGNYSNPEFKYNTIYEIGIIYNLGIYVKYDI